VKLLTENIMAMNVQSKLISAGIGFMMMVQNYSFFLAYWSLYLQISDEAQATPACAGTSWWLGYDALVCAAETVFACGMMLGAWWDGSKVLWWIFFVLHLVDAVPGYTAATIFVGTNINSSDGSECIEAHPSIGHAAYLVWMVQVVFYLFYCCFMAGQFYMVVIRKGDDDGTFLDDVDNDKLVIFGIGLMMMIQNFSFAITFWDLFLKINPKEASCAGTGYWLGYNAIVCAVETVFAGGMMFGGWIDGSKVLWWIFFLLHLVDAVPGYTAAVVFLGTNINSDDGAKCAGTNPGVGQMTNSVWLVQVGFYAFYCCCMLGQLYMVVIKEKTSTKSSFRPLG